MRGGRKAMLHRRDAMIGLGQATLGGLSLPALLSGEAAPAATAPRIPARARNCILVFLWGGPPQQDMWDLKPDAPDGIRSQFRPIPTSASGIDISDQMPRIARMAGRL